MKRKRQDRPADSAHYYAERITLSGEVWKSSAAGIVPVGTLKKSEGRAMDNELLPDRIKQAVARDEREHMKPSKKKNAWSKVKRGGKRIAIRKPYHDEYLRGLREATI